MIDPTTIQYPWDGGSQFLNQLPAYNCNQGVDTMLDLSRHVQQSGNYYYEGLVFPNVKMTPTVPGLGTINGVVVIPAGSYVTAISGICYTVEGDVFSLTNAGFNLKLYDKGSKASVFYGDYAQKDTVAGGFQTPVQDTPLGPFLLKEPLIITGPGVLGWEIVNRNALPCMLQVLIDCAVPINSRSIQQTVVSKG